MIKIAGFWRQLVFMTVDYGEMVINEKMEEIHPIICLSDRIKHFKEH